MGKALSNQ